MTGIAIKSVAAVVAASGALAAHAFAAPGGSPADSGSFGGPAIAHVFTLDRSVAGGTMREVPCAAGAQPGARCYLAAGR